MMLPIRDHNPSEARPYVTLTLIGVNVLVYVWGLATQGNRMNNNDVDKCCRG